MIRKMLVLIVCFLLLASCLAGCSSLLAVKENQDLYTVAIRNFLGSYGSSSNGEIPHSSKIGIIETDSQGRVLFYYHEGVLDRGCGYGILQKKQDDYVYYYEYDCVIHAVDDWHGQGEITHAEWFSEEELAAFKTLNDWDLPIDEDKCTKAAIVDLKPEPELDLDDEDFNAVLKEFLTEQGIVFSESNLRAYETFFLSDDYGREMYLVQSNVHVVNTDPECKHVVMIFNPDGTCSGTDAVLVIEDLMDYKEALKEFQQRNGWNQE